jgi:polyisoprenyl-phosphate glycosyltransferase
MENKKLSIILLSFQSSDRLPNAVSYIVSALESENIPFELIIIDDGSMDSSHQVAIEMEKKDQRIKAYQLAKNYTSPYAQFAGLSLCTGGCAAPMPDDFQRPVEHVVSMYRAWEKGQSIIIGYRKTRSDGMLSDLFSNFYYKIMNAFSNAKFPVGGSDGYLIDREVIDLLNNNVSSRNTTPTIELLNLGFNPLFIGYDRPSKISKSRWTLRKKISLALNTFFSSSNFPLRMIAYIGFTMFLISALLISAIVISKIFSDNTLFGFPIQGWATLVVLISFFNGILLLSIGIVAEYLWRMYEEVKQNPTFIIKKKKNE